MVKKAIPTVHVVSGSGCQSRPVMRRINKSLDRTLYYRAREEHPNERIRFVGNVAIDSLLRTATVPGSRANPDGAWGRFPRSWRGRAVWLRHLHRPSNVDRRETLSLCSRCMPGCRRSPASLPHPAHPRQYRPLSALAGQIGDPRCMVILPPQGYLECFRPDGRATLVLPGLRRALEETTAPERVPCLTLREIPKGPITVTAETNTLVGGDFRSHSAGSW